jgi:hypothetical protein
MKKGMNGKSQNIVDKSFSLRSLSFGSIGEKVFTDAEDETDFEIEKGDEEDDWRLKTARSEARSEGISDYADSDMDIDSRELELL